MVFFILLLANLQPCHQLLQNGVCVNTCKAPNYVENEGVCECGMNFQNLNGLCCAEGQVNQNGVCQDRSDLISPWLMLCFTFNSRVRL